jgi:hypothetical protein
METPTPATASSDTNGTDTDLSPVLDGNNPLSVSVTPVSDVSQKEPGTKTTTNDRLADIVPSKEDAPPTFDRALCGSLSSQRPQRTRRAPARYAGYNAASALRSSPESEDEPHADEQEPEPAAEEGEDEAAAVCTPSLKRKRPATSNKTTSKPRSKKPRKTTRKTPAKTASESAVKPRDDEEEDAQPPAASVPQTDKRTSGETVYATPPSSVEKADKVPSTPESPSERQRLLGAGEDGSQPVRRRTRSFTSKKTCERPQTALENTGAAATSGKKTKIINLKFRDLLGSFQNWAQQTESSHKADAGSTEVDVTSTPPSTPPA